MDEAPVFYPTIEDMSRPFEKFIESIEDQVADCGICKIVPPAGWVPRATGYDNLDHVEVPKPIRQHVTGSKGVYLSVHVENKSMPLGEFKKLACAPENQLPPRCDKNDHDTLERYFWKNVTHSPPLYGADGVGSLFDESVKEWNVACLDTLLSRTLSNAGASIPGVTTPYLYYGMWRSMFAWHTEDVDLYSVNYLHFGEPKSWYTIKPAHRTRFERLLQGLAPHLHKNCPQFLRHKEMLVTPQLLQSHNIPVTRVVQEARQFIINFPGVYHAGFNHGFNCAESTNFATKRWVSVGEKARPCNCSGDSVKIDMRLFGPSLPLPHFPRNLKGVHFHHSDFRLPAGTLDSTDLISIDVLPPAKRLKKQTPARKQTMRRAVASKDGAGRLQAIPSLQTDHWVQCELCDKWRRLNSASADAFSTSSTFWCKMLQATTCRTPEEAYDEKEEIVEMTTFPQGPCEEGSKGSFAVIREKLLAPQSPLLAQLQRHHQQQQQQQQKGRPSVEAPGVHHPVAREKRKCAPPAPDPRLADLPAGAKRRCLRAYSALVGTMEAGAELAAPNVGATSAPAGMQQTTCIGAGTAGGGMGATGGNAWEAQMLTPAAGSSLRLLLKKKRPEPETGAAAASTSGSQPEGQEAHQVHAPGTISGPKPGGFAPDCVHASSPCAPAGAVPHGLEARPAGTRLGSGLLRCEGPESATCKATDAPGAAATSSPQSRGQEGPTLVNLGGAAVAAGECQPQTPGGSVGRMDQLEKASGRCTRSQSKLAAPLKAEEGGGGLPAASAPAASAAAPAAGDSPAVPREELVCVSPMASLNAAAATSPARVARGGRAAQAGASLPAINDSKAPKVPKATNVMKATKGPKATKTTEEAKAAMKAQPESPATVEHRGNAAAAAAAGGGWMVVPVAHHARLPAGGRLTRQQVKDAEARRSVDQQAQLVEVPLVTDVAFFQVGAATLALASATAVQVAAPILGEACLPPGGRWGGAVKGEAPRPQGAVGLQVVQHGRMLRSSTTSSKLAAPSGSGGTAAATAVAAAATAAGPLDLGAWHSLPVALTCPLDSTGADSTGLTECQVEAREALEAAWECTGIGSDPFEGWEAAVEEDDDNDGALRAMLALDCASAQLERALLKCQRLKALLLSQGSLREQQTEKRVQLHVGSRPLPAKGASGSASGSGNASVSASASAGAPKLAGSGDVRGTSGSAQLEALQEGARGPTALDSVDSVGRADSARDAIPEEETGAGLSFGAVEGTGGVQHPTSASAPAEGCQEGGKGGNPSSTPKEAGKAHSSAEEEGEGGTSREEACEGEHEQEQEQPCGMAESLQQWQRETVAGLLLLSA